MIRLPLTAKLRINVDPVEADYPRATNILSPPIRPSTHLNTGAGLALPAARYLKLKTKARGKRDYSDMTILCRTSAFQIKSHVGLKGYCGQIDSFVSM